VKTWNERKGKAMEIFTTILYAMMISFIELLYLFGVLVTIGFMIGVIEKYIHTYLFRSYGTRGILFTAWIGTPIHEIGHLVQCFIWGHRVTRVKLLQINHVNGVLGFVEHQYDRNSMYHQVGNFFIGIGPIISGVASLVIAMYFLIPQTFQTFTTHIDQHVTLESLNIEVFRMVLGVIAALIKSLFTLENLLNPFFWIYSMIAICISSHIALSKQDMKGSARGLIAIFIVLVLAKLVTGLLGFNSHLLIVKLAEYNAYVLAFSSVALFFSLAALLISFLLFKIKVKSSRGV
jgi:hypothetical protein